MDYRIYLQQKIYLLTDPLINLLYKMKITPDGLTATGFVLNLVAAGFFCWAAFVPPGKAMTLAGIGGCIILLAGLFDLLDGRMARKNGLQTRFGALFDSTMDRYSEMVTLGGLFVCLFYQGYLTGGILTMAALCGSFMVSYVRARAEGLDIECKVGLLQRPERVVITAASTIFCWIFKQCTAFDPMLIIIWGMGIIAVLANWTALVRLHHCHRILGKD